MLHKDITNLYYKFWHSHWNKDPMNTFAFIRLMFEYDSTFFRVKKDDSGLFWVVISKTGNQN